MTERDDKNEPTTRELRIKQQERTTEEHRAVGDSATEDEAHTHERRASKSEYLERKLAERERSEQEAAAEEDTEH
jgi:hypothetical protein